MTRSFITSFVAASISVLATPAVQAQFEAPSPERFFGFLDRDRNGVIDRKEAENAPGPMRDVLSKIPNLDRGVTQKDFEQIMPKLMDEFRRRREDEGRSREDRGRDERRGDDRSRDERREGGDGRGPGDYRPPAPPSGNQVTPDPRSTNPSSKSVSKKPVPKTRVTVDLPRAFRSLDTNNDGQIGLYEWDRAKLAEFQGADRNGDGILTAKEILSVKLAPAAPKTSTTATASASSPAGTPSAPAVSSREAASSSRTAPPSSTAPNTPIQPVKVDFDSAEGRMAKFVFTSLDVDKDGSLTEAEWTKSQSIRQSFEKLGAKMPLPIKQEDFAGWRVAVVKAGGK